jgi:protein-tyrosine-phosphatase
MPSVLFVCTANRFRSPLAEGWFRHRLEEEADAHNWSVASAGTWTEPGQLVIPSPTWAKEHFGIDLSTHRSQAISGDLLAKYDLILVMENSHRESLSAEFPETKGRLFMLSQVVEGMMYDIQDHGEQPGDTLLDIATELRDLINKGFGNICWLARQLHAGKKT